MTTYKFAPETPSEPAHVHPLAFWMYTSVSTIPFEETSITLERLTEESRIRNRNLSLTGSLIFTGSRFAQYIEGPDNSLDIVRQSIQKDSRHKYINTIGTGLLQDRNFPGWALSYSRPSKPLEKMVEAATLRGKDTGNLILLEMLRRLPVKQREPQA